MKTINLNLPIEPYKITLKRMNDLWESVNGMVLRIKQNPKEKYQFKIVEKDIFLNKIDDKDLIHSFLNEYVEKEKEKMNIEASGFDTDEEESVVEKPDFDPEQIRIDPKTFNTTTIRDFIDDGDLDISPDFQRNFVWEHKRKSRLIESLMLRIPLPMFYLAQDKEGVFQVVDGLQRLTTIYTFVKDQFVLKDLEYLYKDCSGKKFSELEPKYRRRIEQAQFVFNVIDSSTPVNVKFELFKRINQGGKYLNSQEIRNSMAKPETRQLLNNLVKSDVFIQATDNSVGSLRMDDQELALRFIGFYWAKLEQKIIYRGDMESFLDEVLDKLNQRNSQQEFEKLENAFQNAMENAHHLFGKYAFRKCKKEHLQENAKKQLLNKSLFTVWSVVLSQYDSNPIRQNNAFGALNTPLAEMLEQNLDYFEAMMGEKLPFNYFDSITTGTNQISKLDFGFEIANFLIKNHVKI